MSTLALLDELPAGYILRESPRAMLVVRDEFAATLERAGYGLESDGELATSELAGRRPLLEIVAGGEDFLVRRFTHGGLMRWMTRERYLDAGRPFRELLQSEQLLRMGILTPLVVAARARMSAVCGWQLDLVTRREPDTIDLGHLLGRARRGTVQRAAWRRLLRGFGTFVRRLHDVGFLHADLQPNNFLVRSAALEDTAEELALCVLDLDGSELLPELSVEHRRSNLRRLFRHVRRRDIEHGVATSHTDYLRFLTGYDPSRETWKGDWRAIDRDHQRTGGAHRVGWWFERLFADAPDPRSG